MNNRNRVVEVDVLRGLCMLWIVGFWHLSSYSPVLSFCIRPSTELVTWICLGTFVFISGYVLALRYSVDSRRDALAFLWNRFLRIYPPYFVALLAFFLLGWVTSAGFVYAALLLKMLVREPLLTLWFVNLIFLFYLITPVLLYRYRWWKVAIFCVVSNSVLLLVYLSTSLIDLQLPMFLPAYCAGVVTGKAPGFRRCVNSSPVNIGSLLLLIPAATAYILWFEQPMVGTAALVLAMLSCIPSMWKLGGLLARVIPPRLITWLSYSSFSVYLLHRITYYVGVTLYQPNTVATSVAYLMLAWLPLTMGAASVCQMSYDKALNKLRLQIARKTSRPLGILQSSF